MLKDTRVYSVNVNLLDQSIEFEGKLSTIKDSKDVKISEIFHCKGLLLCTTLETGNTRVVVWNPCTGQTTRIKRTCFKNVDKFALGYDNSCHSYKILKFSPYKINAGLKLYAAKEFEMYEFSSESWRVLDDVTPNVTMLSSDSSMLTSGVSLKGNTYWLASDEGVQFILRFDFATERFGRVSLPFQRDVREDCAVLSVVREQQLSVLRQKTRQLYSLEIQIWVTNNIDDTNEVLWSIVVDFGNVIMRNVWLVVSLLDGDNEVAVCSSVGIDVEKGNLKTRIHIFGEDIDKKVYEETFGDRAFTTTGAFFLNYYVPSLVRIEKNKPQGG